MDGKGAFLASTGVGISAHPVWSPDGSSLLFAENPVFDHPRVLAVDGKAKASCTSSLNWMGDGACLGSAR